MTIVGLEKYLVESGLAARIDKMKPGDEMGIEIPIDEENGKWLRFWLSTEGHDDKIEYCTFDFEGVMKVRTSWDIEEVEDWVDRTGLLKLFGIGESETETDEQEEKV